PNHLRIIIIQHMNIIAIHTFGMVQVQPPMNMAKITTFGIIHHHIKPYAVQDLLKALPPGDQDHRKIMNSTIAVRPPQGKSFTIAIHIHTERFDHLPMFAEMLRMIERLRFKSITRHLHQFVTPQDQLVLRLQDLYNLALVIWWSSIKDNLMKLKIPSV
ncbi:MAG: hypothetical protein ACK53Y_10570, partial [bacterium]